MFEGTPHGHRGARSSQRQGRVQDVGIVSALSRIFALQENMRVRVDKTGQDGLLRQIDDGCASWDFCRRRIAHTFNPVAMDHDHLIAPRLVGLAVDQRAGTNHSPTVGGASIFSLS